jgi:hypothetical protein
MMDVHPHTAPMQKMNQTCRQVGSDAIEEMIDTPETPPNLEATHNIDGENY